MFELEYQVIETTRINPNRMDFPLSLLPEVLRQELSRRSRHVTDRHRHMGQLEAIYNASRKTAIQSDQPEPLHIIEYSIAPVEG